MKQERQSALTEDASPWLLAMLLLTLLGTLALGLT